MPAPRPNIAPGIIRNLLPRQKDDRFPRKPIRCFGLLPESRLRIQDHFHWPQKVLSIRWSIVRPDENQWFAERIVPTVAGVFAVFFRMRRGESTG